MSQSASKAIKQVNSSGGVKKGKASWAPASLNEFYDKEPGYRYRMSRKDAKNLAAKAAEGWETVSGIQSSETKHNAPDRIEDGKPLTSVQEGHDWVLQRLPEELAEGRDEYMNEKAERHVAGLTSHLRKDMRNEGGNAPVHGSITISSRQGERIIE